MLCNDRTLSVPYWGGDSGPRSDSMLVTARVADFAPSVARPFLKGAGGFFPWKWRFLNKVQYELAREMIAVGIEARRDAASSLRRRLLPPQPDASPSSAAIHHQPLAEELLQ